jgi:hypothetical protein
MNATQIQQLGALRPNDARRAVTNLHLTAAELARFKALAKACGLNFSALTRAALRVFEKQIKNYSSDE